MNRRDVDARIVSVAGATAMVVTTRQLADAGVPRHLIRSRVGGLLTPLCRGVYVIGVPTPNQRLRGQLAAVPGAAVACRSAAVTHGLAAPSPLQPEAVVAMEQRSRRSIDGVRLRSTRWLPAEDVTVIDGTRVTTVARTLCDLAPYVGRARLRHLVERAVTDQQVTIGELQACLASWCRRGRPGSRLVRALDHDLFGDEPIAHSELERRAVRLLGQHAGLEGWVGQYRPPWYDGVRGVVDLAWPERRVVVELDGRRWHTTTQAYDEDRRRDRLAVANGWVTLRFSWGEVVNRPGVVVDECRTVLAARRPAATAGS